jgi:hypothetical protein
MRGEFVNHDLHVTLGRPADSDRIFCGPQDYKNPEDIIGENGLLKQLTKALLERAMQAELTEHLGFETHDPAGHNSGNSRNGATTKTLKGDFGEMPLETPRGAQKILDPGCAPYDPTVPYFAITIKDVNATPLARMPSPKTGTLDVSETVPRVPGTPAARPPNTAALWPCAGT